MKTQTVGAYTAAQKDHMIRRCIEDSYRPASADMLVAHLDAIVARAAALEALLLRFRQLTPDAAAMLRGDGFNADGRRVAARDVMADELERLAAEAGK